MNPSTKLPSYRSVGYKVYEDDLDFLYICKCETCAKRVKPNVSHIPLPPSESTFEDVDNIVLKKDQDIHGYLVHHFLPMIDDAVLQVNWSNLDVTYDFQTFDMDTCDRLLFDARRMWSDNLDISEPDSIEPMDLSCPCCPVYKEFEVAGRINDEHAKYVKGADDNLYVCNGYLNAVVMQFNKKLAYMANLKVTLARNKETERQVSRLQKALDKKKAEVKDLLQLKKKDRGELLDANAEMRKELKRTQEELIEARKRIRRLESQNSNQECEIKTVNESKNLLEKQVAGCPQCKTSFTSGTWGACMGGCEHIFCLDCAKQIISSRSPLGRPSDYTDAMHPMRIYTCSAIKPQCPKCGFPSEFVSAVDFSNA